MRQFFEPSRPTHTPDACDCHQEQFAGQQNSEHVNQKMGAHECDRFFTLSSDILSIVGFDGYFKRLSSACERILGFSQEELLAEPFLQFVHPEDQAATIAVVQYLATGERVDGFENRYRCKDGSYKWLSWNGIAALEENLIYCSARDITAQKQLGETLEQSTQYYKALLHSLNGIVWEFDIGTQQFLFVSQKAEDILGYPVEQWLTEAHFWENHLHPEDREWVINGCQQLVLQRQEGQLEYRMIAADGRIVWLHDIISLVLEAGQPTRLRGVLIDITESQQTKETLHRREQEFRALVENSPDVILRVDQNFRYLYVNPKVEERGGVPPAAYIGKTSEELGFPEDLVVPWHSAVQRVLDTGQEQWIEFDLDSPSGRIFNHSRLVPEFADDGSVESVLTVVRDITELKQLEIALQESEARFRTFMQYSPTAAWISDAEGRAIYVNENYQHSFQLLDTDPIGKSAFDLFPPEVAQPIWENIQHVIKTNQTLKTIEIGPRADGSTGEFLVYKFPLPNSSKTCLVGGVAVDITELKRTETALRQSEARYRILASHFPNGVVLLFDRDLRYVLADGTELGVLGLSKAEIEGRTIWEILPRETCEFVEPFYRATLEGKASISEVTLAGRVYHVHFLPIQHEDESLAAGMVIAQDITDRKHAEEALGLADFSFDRSSVAAVWIGSDAKILRVNEGACQMLGYSREELQSKYVYELDPNFSQEVWPEHWQMLQQQKTLTFTSQLQRKNGSLVPIETTLNYLEFNGKEYNFAFARDITDRLQAEAALSFQREQEQLVVSISHYIRESLNVEDVLVKTVTTVRDFLKSDRAIIYHLNVEGGGRVIAESVGDDWIKTLGTTINDSHFNEKYAQLYQQGRVQAVDDIYAAGLTPCHVELLAQFQVKANLAVPIAQENRLWGLLVVQQCSAPRQWQSLEVELLKKIAMQVAIAIQQAELHQQVQQLNVNLEAQVHDRTRELEQALEFEALLKRITDKVRDSLDETQILQTAVEELATELDIECCDAALYDLERQVSTISYESIRSTVAPAKGLAFNMNLSFGIYGQLLQGQHIQFCFSPLWSNNYRESIDHHTAILSCPLQDEQGVIGDMWLFRPQQEHFSDPEVRLVQQVANQCAIALRQSRLYQAAQAQVTELERLSHLKDDFLSTVSHELRTPMSNIRMAIQMLEILNSQPKLANEDARAEQYFSILRKESDREINLINDLLDLTRLDARVEPLNLVTIDLKTWIPHVLETFEQRIRNQQQELQIIVPKTVMITTDLSYLDRILAELVNNACKYTPTGERIEVSVKRVMGTAHHRKASLPSILITVSNSGVEISGSELERIFDKFYRIPNNDPWKHGGTGLGLALVKRLVERLDGTIEVSSRNKQVIFDVQIPLIE